MATFNHSTLAQLRARMRALYLRGQAGDAVRVAHWLNPLTDAELMALFGITSAQLSALRTRLSRQTALVDNVRGEVGA